jgi:hypothetical protein
VELCKCMVGSDGSDGGGGGGVGEHNEAGGVVWLV